MSLVFLKSYDLADKKFQVLKNKNHVTISTIIINLPKSGDKWYQKTKYLIHYHLMNIHCSHRIGLLKGGKYLGTLAEGQDMGNHTIKLSITCDQSLLNRVTYGPGTDYQIEIYTIDNKIRTRSEGFFSILGQKAKTLDQSLKKPDITLQNLRLCPDLVAKMTITKTSLGQVNLKGEIINLGPGGYQLPSTTQYIMNLKYPPQSYAQTGVSELLATRTLNTLAKGDSIVFNYTFQIPGFIAWMGANTVANNTRQAARLFTLRVIKTDNSVYQPSEECQPDNNFVSVEVSYLEKK